MVLPLLFIKINFTSANILFFLYYLIKPYFTSFALFCSHFFTSSHLTLCYLLVHHYSTSRSKSYDGLSWPSAFFARPWISRQRLRLLKAGPPPSSSSASFISTQFLLNHQRDSSIRVYFSSQYLSRSRSPANVAKVTQLMLANKTRLYSFSIYRPISHNLWLSNG